MVMSPDTHTATLRLGFCRKDGEKIRHTLQENISCEHRHAPPLAGSQARRYVYRRILGRCVSLLVSKPGRGSSLMRKRLRIQGYLAHKKTPTPLGPPYDPRHGPTVGSYGVAVSCERGTPVHQRIGPLSPETRARAPYDHLKFWIQGTVTSTMRRAAHPSGCARCGVAMVVRQ